MRVLILGEGKSGTTALLRSVSAALGQPTELFEPRELTPDDIAPDPLVIKKLLLNWQQSEAQLTEQFDKRLFITRDPRDRLISRLLYDAYNKAPALDEAKRERWLKVLEKKAADPQGVPLLKLLEKWWRISGTDLLSHYVRGADRSQRFLRQREPNFYQLKYEDYVDQNFEALQAYLGIELAAGVVEGPEQRVARKGSHGDWRYWFTRADVRVLRPMSYTALKIQGYNQRDWALERVDSLERETTVDYVRKLFELHPLSP